MKVIYGLLLVLSIFFSGCKTSKSTLSVSSFSAAEKELILNSSENTPMRVFKINNPSDSLWLRTKSEPVSVKENKETLKVLIARMKKTVTDRSEERRVGKECSDRWSPNNQKKKE